MAISFSYEGEMERRWREVEKMTATAARNGMERETIERQRKIAWEKMQREHEDVRWGQVPMQDPPRWSKQVEDELMLQVRNLEAQQKQKEMQLEALRMKMQGAAMLCSITDGVNLWITRWGDGWVDSAAVKNASVGDDAFDWTLLCTRLTKLGRLEVHLDFLRIIT